VSREQTEKVRSHKNKEYEILFWSRSPKSPTVLHGQAAKAEVYILVLNMHKKTEGYMVTKVLYKHALQQNIRMLLQSS
jgi:hypothetical protein